MGAVYEAEHVGTGRTVAIKTIPPALVEDVPRALHSEELDLIGTTLLAVAA